MHPSTEIILPKRIYPADGFFYPCISMVRKPRAPEDLSCPGSNKIQFITITFIVPICPAALLLLRERCNRFLELFDLDLHPAQFLRHRVRDMDLVKAGTRRGPFAVHPDNPRRDADRRRIVRHRVQDLSLIHIRCV